MSFLARLNSFFILLDTGIPDIWKKFESEVVFKNMIYSLSFSSSVTQCSKFSDPNFPTESRRGVRRLNKGFIIFSPLIILLFLLILIVALYNPNFDGNFCDKLPMMTISARYAFDAGSSYSVPQVKHHTWCKHKHKPNKININLNNFILIINSH